MKTSMACLCPEFNMHRMVMQYAEQYYLSAHGRHLQLRRVMLRTRAIWPRGALASSPRGRACKLDLFPIAREK
jgi:hypothetical protein